MKKIAITGATGVVGTALRKHFSGAEFHVFEGDIRDTNEVRKFCRESVDCDALIHLAALVPKQAVDSDPVEAFDINVRGTLNVLEGLRPMGASAPWMFYASSSHVYSSSAEPIPESGKLDPFTLYGRTKLQGEEWCSTYAREFGMKISVGRIFSFSAPTQSKLYFIPAMVHRVTSAPKNAMLEIPGVTGQRDFITVPQICETIAHLFNIRHQGIVNIGTGHGSSLIQIARDIAVLAGRHDLTINARADEPNFHIADVTTLRSLGVSIKCEVQALLREMIEQYEHQKD